MFCLIYKLLFRVPTCTSDTFLIVFLFWHWSHVPLVASGPYWRLIFLCSKCLKTLKIRWLFGCYTVSDEMSEIFWQFYKGPPGLFVFLFACLFCFNLSLIQSIWIVVLIAGNISKCSFMRRAAALEVSSTSVMVLVDIFASGGSWICI